MDDTPIEATQKYVHDIEWPASKDVVLEAMKANGAPDDVLQNVRSRDQEKFVGPNDVHQALWVES